MVGRTVMVALVSVCVFLSGPTAHPSAAPQTSPAAPESTFAGADACRDCHPPYFQAWSATKHAKALSKLSRSDIDSGKCIRCHVTGTPAMIAAEGTKPSLPNVQCEACHGAAAAHVAAAKAGDPGRVRTQEIAESTCTRCHSKESPRYKPFIYRALIGLVHPLPR